MKAIDKITLPMILVCLALYISCEKSKPVDENISLKGNRPDVSAAEKKGNNNESGAIPGIKLSSDKTKVRTGDMIAITLEFSLPEGTVLNLKEDLTGLEGLTITEQSGSGNKIILKTIVDKVESFEIGPVSLSFKDKNSDLNIIKSESVSIEVASNLGQKPEEAALKPIRDIIPTYPLWLKILPWVLGIFALAIVVLVVFYLRKRKFFNKIETNVMEPHVVAEEEIRKLLSRDLIKKGAFKEFYFRLSEIARIYIESLRGFPAAELTTEEIVRRIKNETDRKIIPLLRWMDMVKFADTIPSKDRNDQDVNAVLGYIKETAPVSRTINNN